MYVVNITFTIPIGTDRANKDVMLQNVLSDQGLHCFSLIQKFLDESKGSTMGLVQIIGKVW